MSADQLSQAEALQSAGRRHASDRTLSAAIEGGIQDIKDATRGYLVAGKEKAIELEEGLEGMIQEHPLRAVLIAAGVGLLVGALVCRR